MQSPENFGAERPTSPPPAPQGTPNYGQPTYQQPTYNQPMTGYQAPLPNPTGAFAAPRVAGKRVLKRIDVGSAFKIGAVTYAMIWAILGLPIILAMSSFASFAARSGGSTSGGAAFGGGIIGWVFGIAIYGLVGGIGCAVAAFVYNLVAGWMGGLEMEVE